MEMIGRGILEYPREQVSASPEQTGSGGKNPIDVNRSRNDGQRLGLRHA